MKFILSDNFFSFLFAPHNLHPIFLVLIGIFPIFRLMSPLPAQKNSLDKGPPPRGTKSDLFQSIAVSSR